jgi:hypothetical protein
MLCHTTLKPHRIRTKSMRCGSLPADPSAAIAEKANVPAGIFNVRRLIERRLRIPPLKHTHTRTHARTHACVCAHTQTHSRTIFHTQAQLEKARRSRFRGLHARICGPCQIANSSISGRIYRPDRLPESREANCRVRNWRDGPCPRAFRLRLRLPWASWGWGFGPWPWQIRPAWKLGRPAAGRRVGLGHRAGRCGPLRPPLGPAPAARSEVPLAARAHARQPRVSSCLARTCQRGPRRAGPSAAQAA